jgi:hypothetical protein
MNDSISERIIATCRSRRHCRKHQTWRLRRAWSEMLEPRQLLAADLAATSFDFAGGQPIRQGDAFTATVTVQNLNGIWWLDDAGAFYINVYLSDNSLISTSDMLVGAVYVSGLGAGQSTTKTIDLRSGPYKMPEFDPFRTDNEYYIGVIVDPYNDVSESNENNNANRGDGLDRERVWGERHLPSPATGTTVAADVLNLGQSAMDGCLRSGHLCRLRHRRPNRRFRHR